MVTPSSVASPRNPASGSHDKVSTAVGWLALLAGIKLVAHLLTSSNYGYFRDELYFIAASRHLAFGYVDFPPAVAAIGAAVGAVLGFSQLAIHILPAMAGAALIVITGLMARELGGGTLAQALAALATLAAPTFLGIDSLFSMNPFDELWWGVTAYVMLAILKRKRPWLWLLLGAVVGIGLLTKVTMLYLLGALFVATVLTPMRRSLATPWPWVGAVIAAVLFSPFVLWNLVHGWPSVDFWRNYTGDTDPVSPVGFLVVQIVTMNVISLPLWLAGLYFYLVTPRGRPYRLLGLTFVVLYVLDTIIRAKYYFLAPAYPMLFAGGAVALEGSRLVTHRPRAVRAYIAALATGGIVLAIITLPVLPPQVLAWATSPVRIAGAIGIHDEGSQAGQIPQPFADRMGWPTLVANVARVYSALPASDRARACILARNYGEAGALDLFGPAYHLPHVISGHDNYYLWGPGTCSGAVIIGVGWPRSALTAEFGVVTQSATSICDYCMKYESRVPIDICRQPKQPLKAAWHKFKVYYAEWTV